MIKKAFIVGLFVAGLLVASIFSVTAEEEISHTDDINDVYSDATETNVSRPNVDIYKIFCSKNGKEVQLKLQLVDGGQIKNSELISYSLVLTTNLNEYTAEYYNGECAIGDQESNDVDVKTYSGVGTSELQISFNLSSTDEEPLDILAGTIEFTLSEESYWDMCPNEEEVVLEVTAGGPSEGKIGESIHFSGEASDGTPEYAWLWDFDDGTTSTDQNPIHSYNEAKTYNVTLYVTDADYNEGSSSSLAITISDAEPSNGGDNDGEQESSNSGLILFVVIIAIIVIAGVAIVIYIIRR
jgi:PKD repeat protein